MDSGVLDPAKRRKLIPAPQDPPATASPLTDIEVTPLGPGPYTLADIFTLSREKGLAKFDATQIPLPFAVRISVLALIQVEPGLLVKALDGVRTRLDTIVKAEPEMNPDTAPLGVEDEDDDYEPDFDTGEDTEQILNKLDSAPPEGMESKGLDTSLSLGSVSLPAAPTLNPDTAAKVGHGIVSRVFGMMRELEDSGVKKPKPGLSRLATSVPDKELWITIMTRLATRAFAGLDDSSAKSEDGTVPTSPRPLNDSIRELLFAHVMEDFRRRIEVAASWLCEEWYNDQVMKRSGRDGPLYYEKWVLKVMDGFMSYLNPQDKVFTRFLSEMPELNTGILVRVKRLCRDPTMVQLVMTSLYYLVMMKPPARKMVLDSFQEIWIECEFFFFFSPLILILDGKALIKFGYGW